MTAPQLAVVGLGYWGPNLLRNAWEVEGARVKTMCELDAEALQRQARRYPDVWPTNRIEDVLEDPEIDAVILATPVGTHFELVKRCLMAGKHAFVEKPMASTLAECDELIQQAADRDLLVMPGHTFLYSPPVVRIKHMLDEGEIGDLYFGTCSRVNLGIHQSDVSVVRDLAPHDYSILLYWFGMPTFVRAIGRASIFPGKLDIAFIDLGYADGSLVHVELSWLAPTKLRRTVLVGTRKMVVYEDTSQEQIRVFDRGVDNIEPRTFGEFQLSYRSGDVVTPRLDAAEPLQVELQDFIDSIRDRREPRANAQLGLDVVRLTEATEESLEYNGAPVWVDGSDRERRRLPDRRRNLDGMPLSHDGVAHPFAASNGFSDAAGADAPVSARHARG
jgi:predicted dehydrogenase